MNLKNGCIWSKVYATIKNASLVPIQHVTEHKKSNRVRLFFRKLFYKHSEKIYAVICVLAFTVTITIPMIYAAKQEYRYKQQRVQQFAVSYRTHYGNAYGNNK
jgi:hypothetical protein